MYPESNEIEADAWDDVNGEREADAFAANLQTAEEVAEWEAFLDSTDDGDALASAGMGTDEDYDTFEE